ncbi:MAG: sel1 repeat family protein [Rubrivivax sp.]|nr:sel1 repeat family protein [Rubrivivax sp.]
MQMVTCALLLALPAWLPRPGALLCAAHGLARAGLALCVACSGAIAQPDPAESHRLGLAAFHRGDVVAAMRSLRPAAAAGHAPAQALLAFILEKSGDLEEAVGLYARAADQDDVDGHVGLAQLLLVGTGVAKDEKRALQHFSKAADRGHAGSVVWLAEAYRRGRHGLAPDAPEASLWQQRAAALKAAQPLAAGASGARAGGRP